MLDQREINDAPDLREQDSVRTSPIGPRPDFVIREEAGADLDLRARGLKDCASGAILISIGFAFGGSVFLGNPGLLDWIFDCLGMFWLAKGLWALYSARP